MLVIDIGESMKIALSFDDVLLVPQYNEIASRKDVDVSTKISSKLTLKIPIISSCMDTVTEENMAIAMWNAGGLGILHRYNTIDKQVEMFNAVYKAGANCGVAIGSTGDFFERAEKLVDYGANILCVDVAHGDSLVVIEAIKKLRNRFKDMTIIAGNVATPEGCIRLTDAGADAIRLSIGGGSVCSTRIESGSGLPTLQSLFDCKEYLAKHNYKTCIIADGGIKGGGEIVKSIAACADAVMLGQLLAATEEAPGEIIELPEGKFKTYRGMAGAKAIADWRPETKDMIVPEGVDVMLPYKGPVDKVLYQLIGGLRSGMTYSGARTLDELKQKAQFIQITSAGWTESKPHAKGI